MNKVLVVTHEDGSKWGIPVELIAKDKANYYADHHGGDLSSALAEVNELFEADDYEIQDWAANNMNWEDVADSAVLIAPPKVDWQEGWLNGEKEIIDSPAAQSQPGYAENNDALDEQFFAHMRAELTRARQKWPGNIRMLAALSEEAGEAAAAMLHHADEGGPAANVWKECIQTATMAARLATEGDSTFDYKDRMTATDAAASYQNQRAAKDRAAG